ncbi:hypothetical protein [Caldisericum exile]|uniref:Type 4a pilus biogenesis protein PilO n=1 Tax=Caldisericum exile (strain DSM 21853 / NBRC 104410 / AZM16c01) TaxID=511051 RepID=A0A7U6JGF8_CALEA|nr:hypothetical protein [Caldisericum exile]BAL81440.1 hypothetical protein CSE_13140 [Caldisericum exile AZM16c01]
MKKNGRLTNIFIIIALIEIALVLFYAGFLTFSLYSTSRALSLKTAELQELVAQSGTIETLKSQIEKSKASISEIKSNFFNDDSLLSFFKNFYDICASNGADLQHITFSTLSTVLDTSPPLKTLPVSIEFKANYNSVIKIFEYLENYKMHIKEVNFSFHGIDSSLDIVFYVFTNSSDRWVYERMAQP